MIDAKQAVQIAQQNASDMLNEARSSLEEIERDSYKGREVWSITLGLARDATRLASIAQILPFQPLQYKRFLIDAETGELIAMKLREVA